MAVECSTEDILGQTRKESHEFRRKTLLLKTKEFASVCFSLSAPACFLSFMNSIIINHPFLPAWVKVHAGLRFRQQQDSVSRVVAVFLSRVVAAFLIDTIPATCSIMNVR